MVIHDTEAISQQAAAHPTKKSPKSKNSRPRISQTCARQAVLHVKNIRKHDKMKMEGEREAGREREREREGDG